jgi:hypothetical protein
VDIVIPQLVDLTLRRHLTLPGEQVAFVGAQTSNGHLVASDLLTLVDTDLEQTESLRIGLRDNRRASVIGWAHANQYALIEVHTHGGTRPAQMSAFDLDELPAWVQHLQWRLPSRPYAAVVTTGSTLDALLWLPDAIEPVGVESVICSGAAVVPTGLSLRAIRENDGYE